MITKSNEWLDELALLMQQQLKKSDLKNPPNLVQAGEYLHAALDIFEQAGMQTQANQLLQVMSKIAQQHQVKKDWHIRGLTDQKQVSNILDHGTQFNMCEVPPYTDDLHAESLADLQLSDDLEVSDSDMLEDFEDEKS
jgi:hypothetical protein